MHANQKKKARARNRPRNKCNRSGETEQAKILDVPESVPVSSDLEQVEPQPEPPKVEPNTSAIYLIQKILRKKLLAKKSPSVATSPANAAPAKVPAPPPKLANGNQSDEVSELLKCIGNKLQKGIHMCP